MFTITLLIVFALALLVLALYFTQSIIGKILDLIKGVIKVLNEHETRIVTVEQELKHKKDKE